MVMPPFRDLQILNKLLTFYLFFILFRCSYNDTPTSIATPNTPTNHNLKSTATTYITTTGTTTTTTMTTQAGIMIFHPYFIPRLQFLNKLLTFYYLYFILPRWPYNDTPTSTATPTNHNINKTSYNQYNHNRNVYHYDKSTR